jgi:hypothetical protein
LIDSGMSSEQAKGILNLDDWKDLNTRRDMNEYPKSGQCFIELFN